jgi:hypothetical protein
MSNEKALMQEAWRIGFQSPEGLTIACKSEAEAVRVRFTLYGAVKQFRNGKGEPDPVLEEAIHNCALTITPNGVLIQRKLAGDVARGIMAQLGREPKTVEQYNAEASLERIMQKVLAPEPQAAEPTEVNSQASIYGARHI